MSENPGIGQDELDKLLAEAGMTAEEFNSQIANKNPERKILKGEQKEISDEETDKEENHAVMSQEEIDALFSDEDKS